MSRDDAVRAAAEALRAACPDAGCQGHASEAADAVDAAAPHLTADLVRERDEALAEVERLREQNDGLYQATLMLSARAEKAEAEVERLDRDARAVAGRCLHYEARAEKAEAAIGRVEALCDDISAAATEMRYPSGEALARLIRAALRGDQP